MQLKNVNNHSLLLTFCSLPFAFCLLLFVGCKNEPKLSQQETQGLTEDFVKFYDKFHSDSVYQMAHIQFPLEGYPSGNLADSTQNVADFRWTADKWVMHRLPQFNDTLYSRQFEQPMPIMVNEIIIEKARNYGTLRRFLKRENEWYLIFYSDMNRLENK